MSKTISFYTSFTTITIAIVFIVAAPLTWNTQRMGGDYAIRSAKSMFVEVSKGVNCDIANFFTSIATDLLTATGVTGIDTKEIHGKFGNPRIPYMHNFLVHHPDIASMYIGMANGDFVQAISLINAPELRGPYKAGPETTFITRTIRHADEGLIQHWRYFSSFKELLYERLEPSPEFDPRLRPWYKNAQAAGTAAFTEPYVFSSSKKPGVTCAAPLPGGGGVLAVDLTIDRLGVLLDKYRVSENGVLLLVTADGKIVSLPKSLALQSAASDSQFDQSVAQTQNPRVRAIAPSFKEILNADGKTIECGNVGERLLAQATDIGVNFPSHLYTVIASPLDDFTGFLKNILFDNFIFTVGVVIVVTWAAILLSRKLSRSLRRVADDAKRAQNLDFSDGDPYDSFIEEVHILIDSLALMRKTIREYTQDILDTQHKLSTLVENGIQLSAEKNMNRLMEMIFVAATKMTEAESGILFLKQGDTLRYAVARSAVHDITLGGHSGDTINVAPIALGEETKSIAACACVMAGQSVIVANAEDSPYVITDLCEVDPQFCGIIESAAIVPIKNRQDEAIGAIQLMNARDPQTGAIVPFSPKQIGFTESLASQAAVALDNQNLLDSIRNLLDSFIELIAGAIDAKSPYTGGHCSRVPILAIMLAEAAHNAKEGPFAGFVFSSEEEQKEFSVAAWLHDCGKVTTPEYVVDKATKLETITNRIHEVRMRFEVLLRDARIEYLEKLAVEGADKAALEAEYEATRKGIVDDFEFVAKSNVGGESMQDEDIARLTEIAGRNWMRNLDKRSGMSRDELRRLPDGEPEILPVSEPLLADKPEHIFSREGRHPYRDNDYGFKMDVPEHLYNMGELHNLSIRRGTLTAEERFKINEHMVQTIIMLNKLPFPKTMLSVPEFAGGHHETMIGTGYPKRLKKEEMTVPARILAIADIFEALTARDRPYKSGKPLTLALSIMAKMRDSQHIDAELFDLFLDSKVWKKYADKFLTPDQIDLSDAGAYKSKVG